MKKLRVYELAKELNVDARILLTFLQGRGSAASSTLSMVELDKEELARQHFGKGSGVAPGGARLVGRIRREGPSPATQEPTPAAQSPAPAAPPAAGPPRHPRPAERRPLTATGPSAGEPRVAAPSRLWPIPGACGVPAGARAGRAGGGDPDRRTPHPGGGTSGHAGRTGGAPAARPPRSRRRALPSPVRQTGVGSGCSRCAPGRSGRQAGAGSGQGSHRSGASGCRASAPAITSLRIGAGRQAAAGSVARPRWRARGAARPA
ncbi:translation initiation factor IF-2 N-terminal domain-containing protein [Geochorda subterranea]|uniref:Translation initiation factor IF-2 N-terminal domain-containing protein n=1 Tax=Geochorda subterranea TaxID=3109564 RepID=A0ABZ1BKB0_9FIRM|nr:translation initiation factor IF-2 N-terminal domain-containing protein [Limnochorda sp. LNt]WRP13302.1 translation initiation factor IF-2 N-terminal domain-containing protein [Limnochorda sp. LNt]